MKQKIFFGFLFLLCSLMVRGQVQLEHAFDTTYDYRSMQFIKFDAAGYKYVGHSNSPPELYVYNTDYSLYRNIQIPQYPNMYCNYNIDYVSDHLFNSDDLIEYGVSYHTINGGDTYKIINENGVELFSVSGGNAYLYWDGNGHYKLISEDQGPITICNLPGSIPCADDCSAHGGYWRQ